jgi:hypothetical protein
VLSWQELDMSQMGFFDADKRLSMLSLKGDPLEAISKLVPWEMFRADIECVVLTSEGSKKKQGRAQADRRAGAVSDAGAAIAVQSVG